MGEGVIKDLFCNFKLFAREKRHLNLKLHCRKLFELQSTTPHWDNSCFIKVHDYLKRKFAPGSIKKLTLSNSRLQLGVKIVDKPALAREVIAINFHVHLFLQHCKDKATSFANKSETSKAKKKGSTKKGGNNLTEGLSVLLGGGGDSSSEPDEPLLVCQDLVCAGFFIFFFWKIFNFITKLITSLVSLESDCFPYTTQSILSYWFCQLYILF